MAAFAQPLGLGLLRLRYIDAHDVVYPPELPEAYKRVP